MMKFNESKSVLRPITLGFVTWLLAIVLMLPYSPFANEQILVLLFFAPLFLVPLCLWFKGYEEQRLWSVLFAAILFTSAFYFPKGAVGTILVLPWFFLALKESWSYLQKDLGWSLSSLVTMAANIFWMVAASWAILDRSGFSPLDYDPVIILLTVVHFHFAGFILLQLYLLAIPHLSKTFGKIIGILLLTGMPLVAIGISSTQVGLPVWIESLAVTVMVAGGIGVGLGYLYLALKSKGMVTRICWSISSLCLLVGMSLALLYGWRFHHDYDWLSIPWMYAVHGTLNSMGFALFGILGWTWEKLFITDHK